MNKFEILENLITTGEELGPTISYVAPPSGVIRFYSSYKTSEHEKYQDWLSAVRRYVKTNFQSDLNEINEAAKSLSPSNHKKILGILRAIKLMPEEPKSVEVGGTKGTNITINNSQQIAIHIIRDAFKEELSGKEFKEIEALIAEYNKDPEKIKPRLIDRVKNLGGDVMSNIIANILTNPNIYNGIL